MQPNAYTSLILDTATADESAGVRDMSGFDRIVTYITGTGTISGGTLVIEEAASVGYTGTWAAIGSSVTLSDISGGKAAAVHLSDGAYRAIRWRLSDAVTGGGSVSVTVGAH